MIEKMAADFEMKVAAAVVPQDKGEDVSGALGIVVESAVDQLDLATPVP
ncbi:MAG: hypothetical protein R2864_02725 [Syntrophotaleaceae bacterium]